MAYSTISKPTLHFNTKLYTGNGSTNNITGVGFQPDWVWIKNRTDTNWHTLYDVIRGVTKIVNSNENAAESTDATGLTSFNSDGFTHGSGGNGNVNGGSFVSWNWKAGGTGSANTDGSTSATVSANTTAGFSIAKYTGTGSGASIGHGLGATPQIVFYKNLSANADWMFQSTLIANRTQLMLNNSDATNTDSRFANVDSWSNSVFTVGTYADQNENSSQHIAYVFAEKKGYSKFGTYTGNGNADGAFVYTGFKPAMVIIKRTNGTAHWTINDTKRLGYNPCMRLYPNLDTAEETSSGEIDLISNGFKCKNTNNNINGSGDTYVYMAFAEEPLVANVGQGIPATAR